MGNIVTANTRIVYLIQFLLFFLVGAAIFHCSDPNVSCKALMQMSLRELAEVRVL